MNFEIVETISDLSGKVRVRVIIDINTRETAFFKFDSYPSQEEVNLVAQSYIDQLNKLDNTSTEDSILTK